MAGIWRRGWLALLVAAAVLPGPPALAQTIHTRSAEPGTARPAATVAELAWLAGEWRGPGIEGRPAQETWSAPFGGAIAGHFEQQDAKGGVWFYEIFQIVPDGASLKLRLKHFNADLTGWEEKDKTVDFPLIAREGDFWYFNGLTYRRDGPDKLFVAVRMKLRDGTVSELTFPFERVRR